jgi:hypothetical protein
VAKPPSGERRQNNGQAFRRARLRRKHIELLIRDRHGRVPETDDADIYVRSVAECYGNVARADGKPVTSAIIAEGLTVWCGGWAPHVSTAEITAIAKRVAGLKGKMPLDDAIGKRLRLTDADRTRLKITTIGSHDFTRTAREARRHTKKRERDRKRIAAQRAALGRQSRADFLAANSLSREQPWLALGISRRTFYRRLKAGQKLAV